MLCFDPATTVARWEDGELVDESPAEVSVTSRPVPDGEELVVRIVWDDGRELRTVVSTVLGDFCAAIDAALAGELADDLADALDATEVDAA